MLIDRILGEYDSRKALLLVCSSKLRALLDEVLLEAGCKVHSVTTRVKDRDSLKKKLERPDVQYRSLDDVTDVLGARVVTYFDNDVDAVAERIAKEFLLDEINSVDKRALLDADKFGYLSLHYIASLGESRKSLVEYRRLSGVRFEIQIRSILQHAWAEIEHDLGYKSTHELPRDMWRRFFRLAGLLELADVEFSRIREDLSDYEKSVNNEIQEAVQPVPIDRVTLLHFVRNSEMALELDKAIAEDASAYVDLNDSFFGNLPGFLSFLGIHDLSTLDGGLGSHVSQIRSLSKLFYSTEKRDFVSRGASVLFLCYILAVEQGGPERLLEFMNRFSIAMLPEERERFMELVHRAAALQGVEEAV